MQMQDMIDGTSFQVGRHPQVFVDNWLIEQADSVTRRWHKPKPLQEEPVMERDRPWEKTPYFTYSNYNVLKDPADGLIKCWYEDLGPMEPYQPHPWRNRMLYAVSTDGIHFEKPLLGLVPVDGQDTNIFAGYVEGATPDAGNLWADVGVHSGAVVIVPDPHKPEQRYRMLFSRSRADLTQVVECAHSADGIHWKAYADKPVFGSNRSLNDVSTITYDEVTKLFTQYTRHVRMTVAGVPASRIETPSGGRGSFRTYFPHRPDLMNKRRVFKTVSADFLNWTELVPIATPNDDIDNLDEAYYGCGQFSVGTMQFGTMGVFHGTDNGMYVRLIYSRDGVNFRTTDNGRPFIAPRGEGHWDRHMVTQVSPPIRFGDQWYFYHGGAHNHHDYWYAGKQQLDHPEARDPQAHMRYGMGIATLRYEGMVSIDAVRPRLGRLITRPLLTDGRTLAINARCRNGGSIRVAVVDSDDNELLGRGFDDCVPFTGNTTRHTVCWKDGDDFGLKRGPIDYRKLAFLMDDAEIFSFAFEG
jgi:hypothetical protein